MGKSSNVSSDEDKRKKDEEKRLRKLLETPEEKRQRRLEKKLKKEAKKKAKESVDKEDETFFGYSNTDNPFGDSNLREQFTWNKKLQRDSQLGIDQERITAERERIRREELRREIDKVKKRREEREIERQRWEEERARLAREREGVNYLDWEKKEDVFQLQQAHARSEIRIKEGRAKPIDIIAKNLHLDKDFDIEMNEPYKIFKGLGVGEIEQLKKDIGMHLELDESNNDFWQAMMVVCEDELEHAVAQESGGNGARMPGVHPTVEQDVMNLMRGKSAQQLVELQDHILHTINSGDAGDVEYWEALLRKLSVSKAKATLRDMHAQLLTARLNQLHEQQLSEMAARADAVLPTRSARDDDKSGDEGAASDGSKGGKRKLEDVKWEDDDDEDQDVDDKGTAGEAVEAGSLSPVLLQNVDAQDIVDPETDMKLLEAQRRAIAQREASRMGGNNAHPSQPQDRSYKTEDEMYQAEASKLMEEGDSAFNVEVAVDNQTYWWNDKYRPRRPRFFNRVHTGYEWNKYNQTHYDHDNPPPKIVQGYKFNIFYPDLIDKSKPPQYFLEPSDNPETVILRIHAGPPYEDVAFKVVNKEWENSHKRGYKCTFDRGIFHLYFNFKRYRYRR